MHHARVKSALCCSLLAVLSLSACKASNGTGPEADAEPFEADPPRPDAPPNPMNVIGCRTLQTGQVVPVMGTASFNMDAPPIAIDGRVYRISIPMRDTGFVTFTASEAGEHIFYTAAPMPVSLTVFAVDGELVDVKSLRLRVPECPEVNGRHAVVLESTKYVIRVGPNRIDSVDVVVAPPGSAPPDAGPADAASGPASDAAAEAGP